MRIGGADDYFVWGESMYTKTPGPFAMPYLLFLYFVENDYVIIYKSWNKYAVTQANTPFV